MRPVRNFLEKWKQKKYTENTRTWNIEFFFSLNFESSLFTKKTCVNGKIQYQINCASRGFHVYRNIWSLQIGQNLVARQEVGNDHDPFAMSAGVNTPRKLTNFDIVRHIPREISRSCRYFVNYGGYIEARVQESKYRPYHIPYGGLEIPITLIIKKR